MARLSMATQTLSLMQRKKLEKQLFVLKQEKAKYEKQHLSLNMTRGKPAPSQLDLSTGIDHVLNKKSDYFSQKKIDCRNYGELTGIDECKKLLGDMCGAKPSQVIVMGNSSLRIMYDLIVHAMLKVQLE